MLTMIAPPCLAFLQAALAAPGRRFAASPAPILYAIAPRSGSFTMDANPFQQRTIVYNFLGQPHSRLPANVLKVWVILRANSPRNVLFRINDPDILLCVAGNDAFSKRMKNDHFMPREG
jgi:hypothetical protein